MAEHGAFITSATYVDKPTIFEVLAQENLMTTVRPALKHAVRVLAENRPAVFGWLLRCYDEIYTGLDFLVQTFHLQKYSGSFAENFYDLKRIPSENPSSRLHGKQYWLSLFYLVAVPYLKTKLDQLFEDLQHKYGVDRETQTRSCKRVDVRTFLVVYPYLHASWELLNLCYQMAYLLGKGDYHSPLLQLSGTRLCHLEDTDMNHRSPTTTFSWKDASLSQTLVSVLKRGLGLMAITLSSGLSVGMFFLQFLEWWYASDTKTTSLTSLPVPDPPTVRHGQDNDGLSPLMCPVCGRARTNDTALSVSGYVFCYRCIHGYIKQHGQCPVTGYPATNDHLIKVYVAD